ncbi:MAG: tetratricopeptide repeat protein [Crocinitomicaceae bacterium]|nr:tetratricopeptide repeat protein [Crocinitomicaceae bacterium]
MRSFFLSILWISFGTLGWAQSKEDVKEADKFFKQEMYEEAMPLYQKFLNIDPTNAEYAYKFGSCLVMLNKNNDKALEYLLAAKKQGKSDKEIAYFIGRAYENKGEFSKAVEHYEKFVEVADKEQVKALKIKKRIKSCKKSMKVQ